MFDFDNIGFTNTVDSTKVYLYLENERIQIDCEISNFLPSS